VTRVDQLWLKHLRKCLNIWKVLFSRDKKSKGMLVKFVKYKRR